MRWVESKAGWSGICIFILLVAEGPIPIINEPVVTLKRHKARVTDLCWSVFNSNQLLSVSYDGKAVVSWFCDVSWTVEWGYKMQ